MLDRRLKRLLPDGMEALTVRERGWSGEKNGDLLAMAAREFDAFLTTGQDLSRFDLLVLILQARSNAFEDLEPLMKKASGLLSDARPGEAVIVEA